MRIEITGFLLHRFYAITGIFIPFYLISNVAVTLLMSLFLVLYYVGMSVSLLRVYVGRFPLDISLSDIYSPDIPPWSIPLSFYMV